RHRNPRMSAPCATTCYISRRSGTYDPSMNSGSSRAAPRMTHQWLLTFGREPIRNQQSAISNSPTVPHIARDVSELGGQPKPRRVVADAPNRADERAGLVERQRRHAGAEVHPDAVLTQILLDVRQVE